MRILGLDFGSKTVGVAISDPLGITAQGVEIIRRQSENKLRQTLARIEEIISEYGAEKIVLGLPKNMNDTCGDRVDRTLEFKAMLERRTGLEVITWDERLTTVSADKAMMEAGIRRERRKDYVDMIEITSEDGEQIQFYVVEQTRVNGKDYILVTETEDEEAEAYILKDVSSDKETEAVYEFVEEEDELNALAAVFSELVDDTDIV